MNETLQRETLTVAEAAKALGLSRNSVYEGVRRGEIPALRIGRRVVIPRTALAALFHELRVADSAREEQS